MNDQDLSPEMVAYLGDLDAGRALAAVVDVYLTDPVGIGTRVLVDAARAFRQAEAVDKRNDERAVDLVRRLERYLTSMPDAGLTNDDPRSKWFSDSWDLREEARAFLRDVERET